MSRGACPRFVRAGKTNDRRLWCRRLACKISGRRDACTTMNCATYSVTTLKGTDRRHPRPGGMLPRGRCACVQGATGWAAKFRRFNCFCRSASVRLNPSPDKSGGGCGRRLPASRRFLRPCRFSSSAVLWKVVSRSAGIEAMPSRSHSIPPSRPPFFI